jgi:hypothetical protein
VNGSERVSLFVNRRQDVALCQEVRAERIQIEPLSVNYRFGRDLPKLARGKAARQRLDAAARWTREPTLKLSDPLLEGVIPVHTRAEAGVIDQQMRSRAQYASGLSKELRLPEPVERQGDGDQVERLRLERQFFGESTDKLQARPAGSIAEHRCEESRPITEAETANSAALDCPVPHATSRQRSRRSPASSSETRSMIAGWK